MIIAISGSQGTGKSTLLTDIKKRGYHVVERKTARSILTDWNVSLSDVYKDLNLFVKFQDELAIRKFQDEHLTQQHHSQCFTERTFTDLFVYALFNIGNQNEYSAWLNEYYSRCVEYNQSYSHVFFLVNGQFPIEDDGVRGINIHYSNAVDLLMSHYYDNMTSTPVHDITVTDRESRVDWVLNITNK